MTVLKKHESIEGHGFRNLLFFLLLYIIGSPFLSGNDSLAIFAHTLLTIALLIAVYAIRKQQKQRSVALALFLPLLVLYWLGIYDIVPFSRPASYFLFCIFYGLLVHSFIFQILSSTRVTIRVLYAALCLYLIIGLFWGSIYTLLYEFYPDSYSGALLEKVTGNLLHIFNYFSFVTLTTLGYGDITPQTPGAAAFCQTEAIMGQFFTAVVVAWLVGNFVSDKQEL